MRKKLSDIDALLYSGGISHVLGYERYVHLKDDSRFPGKRKNLPFSEEELDLFGRIEIHEKVFRSQVRGFFDVKTEWENSLKDALSYEEGGGKPTVLGREIKRYLNNLKLSYAEVEHLEEHKLVAKLEEFVSERIKNL